MMVTEQIIAVADAYWQVSGLERESRVSHRAFGDSKKLAQMRAGAGITVERYNDAMRWFHENWPEGHPRPRALKRWAGWMRVLASETSEGDAA